MLARVSVPLLLFVLLHPTMIIGETGTRNLESFLIPGDLAVVSLVISTHHLSVLV